MARVDTGIGVWVETGIVARVDTGIGVGVGVWVWFAPLKSLGSSPMPVTKKLRSAAMGSNSVKQAMV